MTAAQQTADPGNAALKPQKMIGEWFWRFLAVVMVLTVGWVLWIIYQINPQPLITKAGFEAAAKARASQGAKGVIKDAKGAITPAAAPVTAPPAGVSSTQAASAQAEAPKPPVQSPPAAPKEPPVNVERLRFADSIETPIPERGKKK